MAAGKVVINGIARTVDLIDAMVGAADETRTDEEVAVIERSACPATPSRMPPAPAAARCAT